MTTYTTPEVIKDIIYKNLHEIRMIDLMSELISKSKYCVRCEEFKIRINKINPNNCDCGDFVCSSCYIDDISYMQEQNDPSEINPPDYTSGKDMPCLCNISYPANYNSDDDYESHDEDQVWQDMYGISSMSQMY